MAISSIHCSYRTYKYSYVTRGPFLVEGYKTEKNGNYCFIW